MMDRTMDAPRDRSPAPVSRRPDPARGGRPARRRVPLALAILLCAASPLLAAPARLAAMPLDTELEDERYATLADGISGELAERLAWDGAWLVTDERLAAVIDEAGVDSPETLSLASQRELARRAGAGWLLAGAAGGDAGSVRVSLRLVSVDRPLTPVRVEEKIAWSDLPAFLDRAEAAFAAGLGLPAPAAAGLGAGTLELYLRARAENSPVTRLGLLQTCVQGGGFPRARARLAETLLDNLKPVDAVAAFAPLDPGLGDLAAPLPAGSAGPRLGLLKGWLEYRSGNSIAAEGWTRKVLAVEPAAEAWYLLARVRQSLRDRVNAIAALDQALALDAGHAAAAKLRQRLLDEQAAAAAASAGSAPAPASTPTISPAPPPLLSPAPPTAPPAASPSR